MGPQHPVPVTMPRIRLARRFTRSSLLSTPLARRHSLSCTAFLRPRSVKLFSYSLVSNPACRHSKFAGPSFYHRHLNHSGHTFSCEVKIYLKVLVDLLCRAKTKLKVVTCIRSVSLPLPLASPGPVTIFRFVNKADNMMYIYYTSSVEKHRNGASRRYGVAAV